MYEEEEESKWRKVLRVLGKTAVVAATLVGLLWALDRENAFGLAALVLATAIIWWGVLFKGGEQMRPGPAFVYGKDAAITQRPVAILLGGSLEYAYARAQAYVRMRQQLAQRNEKFPMPEGGLFVSDKAISNAGESIRVWVVKCVSVVALFGAIYLAVINEWLFALLVVGGYLMWVRQVGSANNAYAYVYRRHHDGPAAAFQSFSREIAWELAHEYVEQCKAAADAGVIAKPDAELFVFYESHVKRDSKDWPWQEDIKKG